MASRKPIPASVRKNPRYTASTAKPRGRRERCRRATAGLRISAMRPATMKITSTFPAAFASAHSASSASGSSTSWTQRGTTTRGGWRRRASRSAPLSSRSSALAAGPPRGFLRDASHLPPTIARVWLSREAAAAGRPARAHPVRRRRRRRHRAAHAARLPAGPARALRAHVRGRQRRERGRRPGDHAEDRRPDVRGRRRRDHARQPHLPPARDLPVPGQQQARSCGPPTSCAASRAGACA